MFLNRKIWKNAYNTWNFQAVSDSSTNQAPSCLTWHIRRDFVLVFTVRSFVYFLYLFYFIIDLLDYGDRIYVIKNVSMLVFFFFI